MKKLYYVFMWILIPTILAAQSREVKGLVLSTTQDPLIGVSVFVKGTTTGTVTDVDGNYSLSVPSNASTLVFSFIGHKSLEVALGNQSTINATLEEDQVNLNEIVVTANAIARERKELGYSVATIKGDEFLKARETNIVNSMAGKIAGVRIAQQSGTVGGSSRIMIRGANSISSSSEPLFVVDGVPISNSSFNNSETDIVTGGVDVGNRASDINPDDIESMTVLKGAAASALYGSRARNGVIVLTTKKGKPSTNGKKTNVTLNSSFRTDNIFRLPQIQSEYAQGNLGVYNPQLANGWGPKISSFAGPVTDYKGASTTLEGHPDNWKNFYVTGSTYINSISFDGASDNTDYRVSYTNLSQTGIVPNSELGRNTLSFNGGSKITDKLKSRLWMNYVRTTSDGRPAQGSNTTNIIPTILTSLPATIDINELKANLFAPTTQSFPSGFIGDVAMAIDLNGVQNNPYFVTEFNRFSNIVDRLYGGTSLEYEVTPWFNLLGRVGTDYFAENRRSVTRKGTRGRLNGQFDTNDIFEREFQTDLIGSFSFKLNDDLSLKAIVGHQFNQRTIRRSRVFSEGLNIDQLYTFANAQSNVPSNFTSKREIFGAYGDVSLNFKNFAFLNVTGRNDWSSTLPVANNSYFYPSTSLSFLLTEAFPKLKGNIMNYAKVRANVANVGSDEDPYQLSFTYNPLSQASDIYTFNLLFPFNGASAFAATNVLPPTNLLPQRQTSYEGGGEFSFFDSRINLDITAYKNINYDQIISIAIPQSTGYSARRLNVGQISNRGIEALLSFNPIRTKSGFNWDIAFNFNRNINRVDKLAEGLQEFIITSGDGFGIFIAARPGETFNIQGVGWLRDDKGNFVINPSTGLRIPGPRKLLGNIYPDWIMGINNSFSYKNLNFSFLVDIREGGVINSQTVSILRGSGNAIETTENNRTPFIDEGVVRNADGTFSPNTKPVASIQQFYGNSDNSTSPENNTFDASFIKLREIRFSYSIPSKTLKNLPIGNASIALEGRNLALLSSHVPHIDPESNVLGPGLIGEGLERGSVPSTRSLGLNLRITF